MNRLVIALVLVAIASTGYGLRQMESDVDVMRTMTNRNWRVVEPVAANTPIKLVFAVKQTNVKALEALLYRVSTPYLPNGKVNHHYGKHASFDDVNELVKPHESSIQIVRQYIESFISHPVISYSPSKDFMEVVVPASVANAMLNTMFLEMEHLNGQRVNRCLQYSIPEHVADEIDFIGGTVRLPVFSTLKKKQSLDNAKTGPNDLFVTPTFLRSLYQVTATGTQASNMQAVASFLEQYWSNTDLQEFYDLFQNASTGRTVAKQIGDNDESNPGTEAELDVQYITSVGEDVTTWVWYTAGRSPTNPDNEPFLAWLMNVSAMATVPSVFSASYGEDEKSVGFDYASRINTEFMKLGVRGVSLFFASGDSGAGGNCSSSGRLTPDFPSGSPYVTAVGGLIGGTAGNTPTGESVDSISGGGFSDWWPTPSYQQADVTNYIKNTPGLPDQSTWNQSGRGYPDLAAQSEDFIVVQDLIPMPVAGTSCASPTVAGVFALLNDLRVKNGKSPLGFLNPWLYSTASKTANALNDAIVGENFGCNQGGFPATKGWDAASGFGSPNYRLLSGLVANLP